jgi:hypothetical protein
MTVGVYANAVTLLGRNATLTDRTEVWELALRLQPNPILGAGFESFWLGQRLEDLWSKFWGKPNQAHNGYIETYLNLGLIGLVILFAPILATFRKISWDLNHRFELEVSTISHIEVETTSERLPSTSVGQQLPGATFRFQIPNGLASNRRQPTPETRVVNHRHEQR